MLCTAATLQECGGLDLFTDDSPLPQTTDDSLMTHHCLKPLMTHL
jgi:hypothetical protein